MAEKPGQAPGPEPIALDTVEARGATRFGSALSRIILVHADGRRVSIDLPDTRSVGNEDYPDLSPMQSEVVEVLDAMKAGDVLSYDEIATKAGYENTGHLRDFVKKVAAGKGLKRSAKGWQKR